MFTSGILLLSLYGLCIGYRPTPDTQSCGTDVGKFMDDNTRYKFLYYHDGPRTVLALGESPDNTYYGFLPPAKNLFQMRWNCDLEKKARQLTQGCPAKVEGAPDKGMNLYHANLTGSTDKYGKYLFISDAVDFWLLPTDTYPLGPNATFNDTHLYTFANMVYQKIYEVGCNYEQCDNGGTVKASALCVYNTHVPMDAQLYEIGSVDPADAGCALNNTVCQHLTLTPPEEAKCDDLLCKLPFKVQSGFL